MNITILGAGAYACALATIFKHNNHKVTIWSKLEKEIDYIKNNHHCMNEKIIPVDKDIFLTNNLEEAIQKCQIIVVAIPAPFCKTVFEELKQYYCDQHIVIATKGIDTKSCMFVSEILTKIIKTKKTCIISGPSFAVDIVNKVPIGLSLASKNQKTIQIVKKAIDNEYITVYPTNDMIGTEICGAIKNVIAIASGIIKGLGMPETTQAMFITDSLHDIKELINNLGGKRETILSYAGFGDLLLTCTSTKSRNFSFGVIISTSDKQTISNYMNNHTVEGINTLSTIHKLIKRKKIRIPIIDCIYKIIIEGKDPSLIINVINNRK